MNTKLQEEHAQLKQRLAEITDFINSEEYYKLSEREKKLIATQRTAMETYLLVLSTRLWGDDNDDTTRHNPFMWMLMSMLITPPGFPSMPENKNNETKPNICPDDKQPD